LTVTERRRPNSTNPPPIHISFAFFLRWSRSIFTTAVFFFWRNTAAPPRFVTRLKMLWR
jgi:hypothetical protein